MSGRLRLIKQRDDVKAVLDACRQHEAADTADWKVCNESMQLYSDHKLFQVGVALAGAWCVGLVRI